jgi:hypothetical protein
MDYLLLDYSSQKLLFRLLLLQQRQLSENYYRNIQKNYKDYVLRIFPDQFLN